MPLIQYRLEQQDSPRNRKIQAPETIASDITS